VQPWPWCSFKRLREILESVDCQCELAFHEGAAVDMEGAPTPAMYSFTRNLDGELLFTILPYWGDDDFIPRSVIASTCQALRLDIGLFGDNPNAF
jgi:hypothetical protein